MKSLQVAGGENLDDLGMTLSSDDEKSESTNDGGGGASPIQYDPKSSEDDPAGGEELELSFNSSMYSFDDPASLTDRSSSQSVSRSSTPATRSHFRTKKGGPMVVTPQSRLGNSHSEGGGSHCLADMLDRQNNLILELLSKHEQLSMSLQEVRSELRETKETVGRIRPLQTRTKWRK